MTGAWVHDEVTSGEVCRFTCDTESCLMCGAQGVRADSWGQACLDLDVLNKYKYCYTACTLHGDGVGDQPLRIYSNKLHGSTIRNIPTATPYCIAVHEII